MRTCDEIRAIVETSPYWADYVGDGASVPWEDLPYPISQTLWVFKQYLDANWPAAFKLHDFLYDLVSIGLGITREEADLCLYLDILPGDPISAGIVYTAVRVGGGVNFHVRTHWHGPPRVAINPHNMGLAPREGLMSTFKGTLLFEQATNTDNTAIPPVRRVAGWSESVYIDAASISEALAKMITNPGFGGTTFASSRAALLGKSASIVGQRIQQVPPVGASQSFGRVFAGDASLEIDTPDRSLLISALPAGGGRVRRFQIRGIPDRMITQGEFAPTPGYLLSVNTYMFNLQSFSVRGRDTGVPQFAIVSVSGTGLVTFLAMPPFAMGDYIQIVGTTDAMGNKRSGVYQIVDLKPLTFQIQLAAWNWGACVQGNARANAFVFPSLSGATFAIERITRRAVGRSFTGYRGRHSRPPVRV